MDLFDSKRQERLEAVRKASTASKEAARAFLIRAGILLPNGEVAPHLRKRYAKAKRLRSQIETLNEKHDQQGDLASITMRLNKRNETAHLAQGYDCAGSKI